MGGVDHFVEIPAGTNHFFLANDVISNDAHWGISRARDLQFLSVSRFLAPETYFEYFGII